MPWIRRLKFTSPHAAFAWSFEILDCWRAGKAFDPDPDHLGGGGTGKLGAVDKALDIEKVADTHDPGIKQQQRPYDRTRSWFYLIYIDQPEPRNWTQHERWYLDRAVCAFCEELVRKKLATTDCKAKCPRMMGKKSA